jgi:N-carbamoylputrescine amidase
VDCGGLGWVIDPEGEVLATTTVDDPFVTVDVDLDVARRAKATYPRYVRE